MAEYSVLDTEQRAESGWSPFCMLPPDAID